MNRSIVPVRALVAACIAFAAVACGTEGPPQVSELDTLDLEISRLRDQMETLADNQHEADAALARILLAARELDASVSAMRSAERVDSAVARWARTSAAVEAGDPEAVRDALFAVAFAVDDARLTLNRARQRFGEGWEVDYLNAEDDALVAVREFAEAGDVLAQTLVHHWPTYQAIHAGSVTFVEERSFYRTSAEASDAFELAVTDELPSLAEAQAAIGAGLDRRAEAVEVVEDAYTVAAAVWAQRPAEGPSPT